LKGGPWLQILKGKGADLRHPSLVVTLHGIGIGHLVPSVRRQEQGLGFECNTGKTRRARAGPGQSTETPPRPELGERERGGWVRVCPKKERKKRKKKMLFFTGRSLSSGDTLHAVAINRWYAASAMVQM